MATSVSKAVFHWKGTADPMGSKDDYISDSQRHLGFAWSLKFRTAAPYSDSKVATLELYLDVLPPNISQITIRRKDMLLETNSEHVATRTYDKDKNWSGWSPDVLSSEKAKSLTSFTFTTEMELLAVYDTDGQDVTAKYMHFDAEPGHRNVEPDGSSQQMAVQMQMMMKEIQDMKRRLARLETIRAEEEAKENTHQDFQKQLDEIKARLNENSSNDNNMDKEKLEFRNWVFHTLKLPEYYDLFVEQGVETLNVMKTFTKDDLKEMGISKIGHRNQILQATSALKHEENNQVQEGSTAYM